MSHDRGRCFTTYGESSLAFKNLKKPIDLDLYDTGVERCKHSMLHLLLADVFYIHSGLYHQKYPSKLCSIQTMCMQLNSVH